jgi:hypothetical protein
MVIKSWNGAQGTARLKTYWARGAGAKKIGWGKGGDFKRCETQLAKYVHNPKVLAGLCANLHHDATGAWPGHAPGEKRKR